MVALKSTVSDAQISEMEEILIRMEVGIAEAEAWLIENVAETLLGSASNEVVILMGDYNGAFKITEGSLTSVQFAFNFAGLGVSATALDEATAKRLIGKGNFRNYEKVRTETRRAYLINWVAGQKESLQHIRDGIAQFKAER